MNYKRITVLLLALAMGLVMIAGCGPGAIEEGTGIRHPWVFVHGLNGFGDDIASPVSYWGATGGPLLPALAAEGFEVHAPTVSAAGSAWDRAAELYAAITGTQVDYGIAHSENNGHERFGRVYDRPLIEGWGEEDEEGNLRRINIIAHSFGGATARMMAALLLNGCAEERAAALEAGEEVSGLFVGGRGDWIHSLTCLAAPHNGVSLLSVLDVSPLLASVASAISNAELGQTLAAFGINIPGMESVRQFLGAAEAHDTAYADLSITGAEAVNRLTALAPRTFYFSYPVDGTENNRATNDMSAAARLLGNFIGSFTHPASGITDAWRANDGLVNTISATHPFTEPHVNVEDIATLRPAPGTWHVMPTVRGDHGSIIGLGRSLEETLPMYLELMRMVDRLG